MGARESRSQRDATDGDESSTTQEQDYYAILEVDESASADEIRVSTSASSSSALGEGAAAAMTIMGSRLIDSHFHPSSVTAFVPTSRARTSSRQKLRGPGRCDPTLCRIAASV